MVGGDEEIRVVAHLGICVEVVEDLLQISIGVLNGGLRRRAVDAGRELIQAVALRVLRVIGIARPVHEHERLCALRKRGQYRLGRRVGEPLLMLDIRGTRARRRVRPGGLIVAAAAPAAGRPLSAARAWSALSGTARAVPVAPSRMMVTGSRIRPRTADDFGQILRGGGPGLSEGRGVVAVRPRKGEQRGLAEVVAAELPVDVRKHERIFDVGHHRARTLPERAAS